MPARWRGNPGNSAANAGAALLLAAGAWLVSLHPPASILDFLGRTAFPGYASLAPVALAGIYAPWLGKHTIGLALLAGTALVALQSAGQFTPALPVALFNLGIQAFIIGIGAVTSSARAAGSNLTIRSWSQRLNLGLCQGQKSSHRAALAAIVGMGFLGVDFWQYGPARMVIPGLPWWVVYHVALTLTLSLVFWWYARTLPSAQRLETGVSF